MENPSVRRFFFACTLCIGASFALPSAAAPATGGVLNLDEASIGNLQKSMGTGELSAHQIVQIYLDRIAALDQTGPAINAIIELNPDALMIADRLDAERKAGKVRGPLHGIPVLLKDNIDTADKMHTTAGSLALAGSVALKDSTVAAKLRAAGAIILGKTNLSEWANFRSNHSTSGWSAVGGQTKNPYVLDRNPCGSSAGTGAGIAANMAAAGIGTETDGSIVCPSSANGLVGIKPTVGLISRAGIVPISHSQDTAGPMAHSVADAATLLSALTGADSRDAASSVGDKHRAIDYTKYLDAAALKGARIGVVRKAAGFNADVDRVFDASIAALRAAGAIVIDPAELPNADSYGDDENIVLQYEFKNDLNSYLTGLGAQVKARSLADLIAFNEANPDREMRWFDQKTFIEAQGRGGVEDKVYKDALAKSKRLSGPEGIDSALRKEHLDALLAPTNGPAWVTDLVNGDHFGGGSSSPAAVSGYPAITVPAGFVHELPVGITFFASAWSEPKLIALAYAFEQATHARKPPAFLAHVPE